MSVPHMLLGDQVDAIVAGCRRGYDLSYVQGDANEYSESWVIIQFYVIWRLGMIRLGHAEFSSVSQNSRVQERSGESPFAGVSLVSNFRCVQECCGSSNHAVVCYRWKLPVYNKRYRTRLLPSIPPTRNHG